MAAQSVLSDNMIFLTALYDEDWDVDMTPPLPFLIPNVDDRITESSTSSYDNFTKNITLHSLLNTRNENLAIVEITIQAVIFMFAFFGNGIVLLALRYRKMKTSRMHVFIMHLSIADMLVALLNILPQMAWDITFRFQGNDITCRLVKYVQIMVIYLSTYILVVTAVDRYRVICHPLSNYSWTNKKSHALVAGAWALAALFSLPQLFIFKMQEVEPGKKVMDCWANFDPEWTVKVYVTAFSVTVFFLPSLILSLLYGRICYVVWRNVYHNAAEIPEQSHSYDRQRMYRNPGPYNPITSQNYYRNNHHHGSNHSINHRYDMSPENGVRYTFTGSAHHSMALTSRQQGNRMVVCGCTHTVSNISRAKIKTIKLTVVVIVAYILCWAPFIITQMWWAFDEQAPYNSSVFVICLLLASLNSCCNPWIYMAFSESLMQQILPCCHHDRKPKSQGHHQHHEHVHFNQAPCYARPLRKEEERRFQEDIPLHMHPRRESYRSRRSTLLSRTTSTKLTALSNNPSRKNLIMRYSKEHGILAASNLANWPCAPMYPDGQTGCSLRGSPGTSNTKECQCKKCLNAMEEKTQRKRGLLSVLKEKNEDSSKSSSSSSRKKGSKENASKGKHLKVQSSDNSHPFLSFKSVAENEPLSLDNLDQASEA